MIWLSPFAQQYLYSSCVVESFDPSMMSTFVWVYLTLVCKVSTPCFQEFKKWPVGRLQAALNQVEKELGSNRQAGLNGGGIRVSAIKTTAWHRQSCQRWRNRTGWTGNSCRACNLDFVWSFQLFQSFIKRERSIWNMLIRYTYTIYFIIYIIYRL